MALKARQTIAAFVVAGAAVLTGCSGSDTGDYSPPPQEVVVVNHHTTLHVYHAPRTCHSRTTTYYTGYGKYRKRHTHVVTVCN